MGRCTGTPATVTTNATALEGVIFFPTANAIVMLAPTADCQPGIVFGFDLYDSSGELLAQVQTDRVPFPQPPAMGACASNLPASTPYMVIPWVDDLEGPDRP